MRSLRLAAVAAAITTLIVTGVSTAQSGSTKDQTAVAAAVKAKRGKRGPAGPVGPDTGERGPQGEIGPSNACSIQRGNQASFDLTGTAQGTWKDVLTL